MSRRIPPSALCPIPPDRRAPTRWHRSGRPSVPVFHTARTPVVWHHGPAARFRSDPPVSSRPRIFGARSVFISAGHRTAMRGPVIRPWTRRSHAAPVVRPQQTPHERHDPTRHPRPVRSTGHALRRRGSLPDPSRRLRTTGPPARSCHSGRTAIPYRSSMPLRAVAIRTTGHSCGRVIRPRLSPRLSAPGQLAWNTSRTFFM